MIKSAAPRPKASARAKKGSTPSRDPKPRPLWAGEGPEKPQLEWPRATVNHQPLDAGQRDRLRALMRQIPWSSAGRSALPPEAREVSAAVEVLGGVDAEFFCALWDAAPISFHSSRSGPPWHRLALALLERSEQRVFTDLAALAISSPAGRALAASGALNPARSRQLFLSAALGALRQAPPASDPLAPALHLCEALMARWRLDSTSESLRAANLVPDSHQPRPHYLKGSHPEEQLGEGLLFIAQLPRTLFEALWARARAAKDSNPLFLEHLTLALAHRERWLLEDDSAERGAWVRAPSPAL